MFHKPDAQTARILELANFIEGLDPKRFTMNSWGLTEEPRCICGWYQQLHGNFDKMDWKQAAAGMGLTDYEAHKLFMNAHLNTKSAAKALRELAVAR